MALHLYFDENLTNRVSSGTGLNPDEVMGPGDEGFTGVRPLWVANDSAEKRYENVTVTAVKDDSLVNVQYAPDVSGSPGAWVESLNIGTVPPLGKVKFWRLVVVAPGQPSRNRTDIKHRIQGTEFAVEG